MHPVATDVPVLKTLRLVNVSATSLQTFTTPSLVVRMPIAIFLQLTTSAAAGDRYRQVYMTDSSGELLTTHISPWPQAASVVGLAYFILNGAFGSAIGFTTSYLPLIPVLLPENYNLHVQLIGAQTGDTWNYIVYSYLEWA